MYVTPNFRTQKELREAIKNGRTVRVFQPGPFGGEPIADGDHSVEGPHYPEPHKWYARVRVRGTLVVGVYK